MLHIMAQRVSVQNVGFALSKYLQGGISDTQLATCWKERFWILLRYFPWYVVLWKHLEFAWRFSRMGAYGSGKNR
ncbi:MAG: hypothetical protein HC842_04340 [Cytophagales bacterium]|nr:hypothetical protein [Cytophagales bacterium]